jgi:hypothetical protein
MIARMTKQTDLRRSLALPMDRHARVERRIRVSPHAEPPTHPLRTLKPEVLGDRDFRPGCASGVEMVQPTDPRNGDDPASLDGLS